MPKIKKGESVKQIYSTTIDIVLRDGSQRASAPTDSPLLLFGMPLSANASPPVHLKRIFASLPTTTLF